MFVMKLERLKALTSPTRAFIARVIKLVSLLGTVIKDYPNEINYLKKTTLNWMFFILE